MTRRRRRTLTVAVVLAALLVLGFAFRKEIRSEFRLHFPQFAIRAAERRSSPPARASETKYPLPTVADATEPVAANPGKYRAELVWASTSVSALVDFGDGRAWIGRLPGVIELVNFAEDSTIYRVDLTEEVFWGGERGLLGLALNPERTRLFVAFSDNEGDTQIDSWAIDPETLELDDRVEHLTIGQTFANHNGGHIAFGPDGLLWIGTGDGGGRGDTGNLAQNQQQLLGKMLRVEPLPTGGVAAPASNPTWQGVRPEIWAIGLRNPWRYSFDRATGELWIADVGQRDVEEVSRTDFSAAAPNFGWRIYEGDQPFKDAELDGTYVAPTVAYDHKKGCSVTGGYVYRGGELAALRGWYVFGDFCRQEIWAFRTDLDAPEIITIVDEVPSLILSFAELDTGELLALTQDGVFALVER